MTKKANWGILGTGNIAHKFANDLAYVPNAKIVAVASRTENSAKKFALQHNVPAYYGSYGEMLSNPEIDVIYIATPHSFHREHTELCLQRGIAVLCEKPICVNAADLTKLIDISMANKVFVMEALWTRFLPSFQEILKLIRQDVIGNVKSVIANFGFYKEFDPAHRLFDPALAGGSLLDIGIYPIFLAYTILGYPDRMVASATKTATGTDADCQLLFNYSNGNSALLYSSVAYETTNDALIYGEKGYIRIHPRWHESDCFTLYLNNQQPEHIEIKRKGSGLNYEAAHVHYCLQNGMLQSDQWNLKQSLELVRIMDEIRRQINLKYPFE